MRAPGWLVNATFPKYFDEVKRCSGALDAFDLLIFDLPHAVRNGGWDACAHSPLRVTKGFRSLNGCRHRNSPDVRSALRLHLG